MTPRFWVGGTIFRIRFAIRIAVYRKGLRLGFVVKGLLVSGVIGCERAFVCILPRTANVVLPNFLPIIS